MRVPTRIVLSLILTLSAAGVVTRPARAADEKAEIPVRHTPRKDGQDWAVAETADFRVYHNESRKIAELAARVAEAARAAAAERWFGEDLAAWDAPCEIFLFATAEDYGWATHQPPQVAGHSTFDFKDGRVVSRRIFVHMDDPNVFVGVLPHETAHVVLAGHFGARRLPHWADEGMAVLCEPRDHIDVHLATLPRHREDGDLFPVAELMQMDGYPAGQRIPAFYAESVSLVQFLSRRKGPAVFAKFLRAGMADGYEGALKKYYDMNGFDDLQDSWQRQAFDVAAGG